MFVVNNPVASLPPQPQVPGNDPSYAPQFNQYVETANAAANDYLQRYTDSMRQQGVSVTVESNPAVAAGSPVGVPPQYVVTLSRDGITTTSLLSIGRMQQASPEELAAFDQAYNLKWTGQYTSPQGQLPSAWFEPEYSSPAPQTTIPVTPVTIQTAQTAPTPDVGTAVSNQSGASTGTPAATLYNFDQWNWFYEQETGRIGPDPAAVGVADRTALMTKDQWWAKVSAWYNGTGPNVNETIHGCTGPNCGGAAPGAGGAAPGAGGASPGGNSNPAAPGGGSNGGAGSSLDNTVMLYLGLAAVALIFLARKG